MRSSAKFVRIDLLSAVSLSRKQWPYYARSVTRGWRRIILQKSLGCYTETLILTKMFRIHPTVIPVVLLTNMLVLCRGLNFTIFQTLILAIGIQPDFGKAYSKILRPPASWWPKLSSSTITGDCIKLHRKESGRPLKAPLKSINQLTKRVGIKIKQESPPRGFTNVSAILYLYEPAWWKVWLCDTIFWL